MIKVFGLAAALLLFTLPRDEHPDAASLGGRITDEKQLAVAGATVSATNVFSRQVEFTQSDRDGFYRLAGLRQGRYSVFVKTEDYGCKWIFNILLYRDQHTQLDVVLTKSQKKVPTGDCVEKH